VKRLAACVLAGLLLLLSAMPAAAGGAQPFQKGHALGGWWRDDYAAPSLGAQLDALRDGGVEWVELTARWFQAERDSTGIESDPERSPSDESLRRAIRLSRERGLRVLLKPQIDLAGSGWRGEIQLASQPAWAAWFASYRRFLLHYAELARDSQVSLLCVGVELDGTRHREADWRALIRAVRAVYPGPLTYAANVHREEDIRFWDALDFAGVDEYTPLASRENADDDELRAAAARERDRLRRWAASIGRPVLFTEIGFRSVSHAAVLPWEWERHGPVDLALQARLYRIAIEVYGSEPWLAGTYWWQWRSGPPPDAAADDSFTTQGKPAWDAVRVFYRSPR